MKILENLVKGALTTKALAVAFLKSGHSGYWLRRGIREEFKKSDKEYYEFLDWQRFYRLVSKLKKDGLVESSGGGWGITKMGQLKLNFLKNRFLYQEAKDKSEEDGFKIITFDVPEKYKGDREWLRRALKNLGMTMLQRSVFVGVAKLPLCFVQDLKERNIMSCVQIFSVSRKGTLENIFNK